MDENDTWQAIGIDPLFIAYSRLAQEKNLREPSSLAHTGKVLGKFGRYTMLSHCFMDSLMVILNDSPRVCWQLVFYLARNIIGIGRNKQGNPKIYMRYKPTCIMKDAKIKSVNGYYRAKYLLEEKKIIYFKGKNIHLNIFPLTWNIENETDKSEIRDIVEIELNRMIERNENGNGN